LSGFHKVKFLLKQEHFRGASGCRIAKQENTKKISSSGVAGLSGGDPSNYLVGFPGKAGRSWR
jgi:hypothetical protein